MIPEKSRPLQENAQEYFDIDPRFSCCGGRSSLKTAKLLCNGHVYLFEDLKIAKRPKAKSDAQDRFPATVLAPRLGSIEPSCRRLGRQVAYKALRQDKLSSPRPDA